MIKRLQTKNRAQCRPGAGLYVRPGFQVWAQAWGGVLITEYDFSTSVEYPPLSFDIFLLTKTTSNSSGRSFLCTFKFCIRYAVSLRRKTTRKSDRHTVALTTRNQAWDDNQEGKHCLDSWSLEVQLSRGWAFMFTWGMRLPWSPTVRWWSQSTLPCVSEN